MTEAMGYKSAAAINLIGGGTTTFNGSSFRFSYLSHSIKEVIDKVEDEGLRGTRTRDISRVAQGNIHVGGDIVLQPNVAELEAFMPFILGTASSGGTYAEADPLTDMYMMIDNVTEVDTYLLRVNRASFEASIGEKIKLTLNVVGKTLTTGASGSFPGTVPGIDTATRPYMFYDGASGITLASTAYQFDRFSLSIDNAIQPTYMTGQTATDLEPTDRIIRLGINTKYTSTEQAIWAALRAGTPLAGSVAFVNGSNTFSFTFGKLFASTNSIDVPGRHHLRMPFELQAYGVSTTKELVVTLPA